jgi:hypothetical protein
MIADVHETANGKSERASHWHPMGVGGRVPPLHEASRSGNFFWQTV